MMYILRKQRVGHFKETVTDEVKHEGALLSEGIDGHHSINVCWECVSDHHRVNGGWDFAKRFVKLINYFTSSNQRSRETFPLK